MAFTALLYVGHLRKLATAALGMGLSVTDAAAIAFGLLPSFLVFALPLAHLTAVVISLGRMADDGETVALMAAGASPWRLAGVPIAVGVALTILGWPVAHEAQPYGWRSLQRTLSRVASQNLIATITRQSGFQMVGNTTVYAAPDGFLLIDQRAVVVAQDAALTAIGPRLTVQLRNGEMHPRTDTSTTYQRARFTSARMAIDVADAIERALRLVPDDAGRPTPDLLRAAERPSSDVRRQARWRKLAARRTAVPALAAVFGALGTVLALGLERWRALATVAVALVAFIALRAGDAVIGAGGPTLAAVWAPHAVLAMAAAVWLARLGRPQ